MNRFTRNKYGASKSHCSIGHEHDSKREAKRCNDLRVMERGGLISGLEFQKQFYFEIDGKPLKHTNGRRAGMKVDFVYRETIGGKQVAEDAKGFVVRDYPLRAAVFRACFPDIELREV